MAKKTLNEAVVRRFQKLANVAPINEMYSTNEYNMQEEEEAAEAPADDMDAMSKEDDMGAPEADMDMDMGDDGEKSIDVEQGDLQAVVDAIPALQNIADALEGVLDGGEEMDMDMDMDKPDMDPMAPADDAEDEAADAIMEALSGISYQPSQAEIVNEVAQRVARRLQAAKLHEAKLNKALGRK